MPKIKSNSILASGIFAMGLIVVSILATWKYSIETAEQRLHEIESLRQATVYIDKMRQIALHRTSILFKMRSQDDIFKLDELNREFSIHAIDFINVRNKLLQLELSDEVRQIWKQTGSIFNATGIAQKKAAELYIDGNRVEADKILLNEAVAYQNKAQQYLSKMLDAQQTKSESALTEGQQNKRTTTLSIFIIGVIALILMFAIMNFILRISSQIQKDLLYADEAKLANKMKSDFLARMSHEIRTPLGAILGYAEASLNSDQEIDDRLIGTRRIIYNAKHLLDVINDILDLSKVESGRLEIEHIELSPIQIANEVCNITKIKADEKQLTCCVNYVLPLPKLIKSDPTRIKQILINLMSNAIKFTEHGHVYLKVSYSAYDEKVHFEIEDTGIGITDKQQNTIFNAFTQADVTTTRKYGGTGLGLNLSRDLVSQLGGELSVKSKIGFGSKFSFSLDCGKAEDLDFVYELSEIKDNEKGTDYEKKIHKPLKGKVLLVDDNEDNQRIIGFFIKNLGTDVTIAGDGIKALEEYHRNKAFDLIFMDMQMPNMDGPSATKKLRELGCTTPVIALTANAYKEDQARCFAAGCTGFISKPVSQDQLYDVLCSYLVEADVIIPDSRPIISTLLAEEPRFENYVKMFVEQLATTVEEIKKTALNKNWDEMRVLIHDVKGTAGMAGYQQLGDVSGQIDFQLRNKDYAKVQLLLEKLENIAGRISAGKDSDSAVIHHLNPK